MSTKSEKVKILNTEIDNISLTELLERLSEGVVFTPNVDHLVKLERDTSFQKAYSCADYKVCDSKILLYISKFLGTPIKERVAGSDFFPAFYNYHKYDENIKIFLLGASDGVARKAREKINAKVGREMVVGCYSPPFGFENDEVECSKIIQIVRKSGATVLAIGLGAPKQEIWIYKYKHLLPCIKIFLAVGATIDFEAGHKLRAPNWMREVGLEWLHRLVTEPKRLWRRYLLEDTLLVWLILKNQLKIAITPPMSACNLEVLSGYEENSVKTNQYK